MAKQASVSLTELKRELDDLKDKYPRLEYDQLFVLWFLLAFITDDESEAVRSLCGGANDKGFDAVLVDERSRIVVVVQGKYRKKLAGKTEKRNDVLGCAELAGKLTGDGGAYTELTNGLDGSVLARIEPARKRILKDGYRLHLYYVTLGKVSKQLASEAAQLVKYVEADAALGILDGHQVMLLLSDYLDGVAPPVPSLELEMESGEGIRVGGSYNRFDSHTSIESWVFSMASRSVAQLYAQAGDRLFARNVRGFLGSTDINRGMETTLKEEPGFFWYYNNGITIVCDEAEERGGQGKKFLSVKNPQVINGQQTTRTLYRWATKAPNASVTVRVIRVPRQADQNGATNHFDTLVTQIVSATNWQNAIRPSDLMSNDRRQIEIERQFRKFNYRYVRKRQAGSEVRGVKGSLHYYKITKETLAQAVAACDLDPAIVREGKENLFEERYYTQVFPNADPYYYLCRYWLMSTVSYAAKGYPERAYAKWVVLHFMWSQVRGILNTRARMLALKRHWEKSDDALGHLWRANNAVFKAVLQFYRKKRGKGAKAADVSTFFRRRNLHTQFAKFWRGTNNKWRAQFQKALRGLVQELDGD